jgi:hypothetical protein
MRQWKKEVGDDYLSHSCESRNLFFFTFILDSRFHGND